jgi:hypothetical protein
MKSQSNPGSFNPNKLKVNRLGALLKVDKMSTGNYELVPTGSQGCEGFESLQGVERARRSIEPGSSPGFFIMYIWFCYHIGQARILTLLPSHAECSKRPGAFSGMGVIV